MKKKRKGPVSSKAMKFAQLSKVGGGSVGKLQASGKNVGKAFSKAKKQMKGF